MVRCFLTAPHFLAILVSSAGWALLSQSLSIVVVLWMSHAKLISHDGRLADMNVR